MKIHIKKGDTVKVIAGDSKGQQGQVLEVIVDKYRALVEGVNLVSKHTKANAKERNLLGSGIFNGFNHALNASVAKTARYQDTINTGKHLIHISSCIFNVLCINHLNAYFSIVTVAGML